MLSGTYVRYKVASMMTAFKHLQVVHYLCNGVMKGDETYISEKVGKIYRILVKLTNRKRTAWFVFVFIIVLLSSDGASNEQVVSILVCLPITVTGHVIAKI